MTTKEAREALVSTVMSIPEFCAMGVLNAVQRLTGSDADDN